MARLDVYPALGSEVSGYVIDVQGARLEHLRSRALVPLLPQAGAPAPLRDLNPIFEIVGMPHVMATQFIFTAPVHELGKPITSLGHRHDEIRNALDFLFGTY